MSTVVNQVVFKSTYSVADILGKSFSRGPFPAPEAPREPISTQQIAIDAVNGEVRPNGAIFIQPKRRDGFGRLP